MTVDTNPGEAEDLMQDVFLEIFNKADQFDVSSKPFAELVSHWYKTNIPVGIL